MKKLFGILSAVFAVGMLSAQANGTCNPCCEQEEGAFIQADVLVWKAARTGLDYALEGDVYGNGQIVDGRMHSVDFDWNLGFRLGLGYRLPCDRWDIKLLYTRFHSTADGSISDDNASNLNPNIVASRIHPLIMPVSGYAEKVSAEFEVGYDVVDLLLGHGYCPCPSFELHPFIGLRALFLNQTFTVDYKGHDFASTGNGLWWESDYNAFGIHGGTDIYYHVCGDFSFYGNLSGSVLFGKADGHQKQKVGSSPEDVVDVMEPDMFQAICGCHGALGIMWERCCGDTVVAVTFGYEVHKWTSVPEVREFYNADHIALSSDNHGADLGFHGGFLRARVDF